MTTPTPWPVSVGSALLREATAADIEHLLTFRNDPVVNRFMMRTRVDPDEFRQAWLAIPESDTDFSCVAERDGQVVAMGFLEKEDASGQPGKPVGTQGLIGYIVDPSAWRTGVATDVVRGLLQAAFERLGLRRVVAYCNADNLGSVRSLEKSGMRREQHGIKDCWHDELGWVDGYQYAMLADEWNGLRTAEGPTDTGNAGQSLSQGTRLRA